MRLPAVLYLCGMVAILLGERMIGGDGPLRLIFSLGGVLSVLAALVLVGQKRKNSEGDRQQLVYGLVGAGSLVLYFLSTDTMTGRLGLDDEGLHRLEVVLTALWSIVWLAGTLPFLAIDRALSEAPIALAGARVRSHAAIWLSVAFAIAMLFPVNYLGAEFNKRWDLGYFKTAEAGTSTINIVENLDIPITVYLFFPVSSDVTDEVRGFFDPLDGGNLVLEYVDHALEPELAKELGIRDNGHIALVSGEGEDQQVERIKVGVEFDTAKRTLKKLDEEVRESLIKLSRGPRVAYVTVGHGEMYWNNELELDRKINDAKRLLRSMNFKVKELGLTEGLANEIPEDATLVMVMGPEQALLDEEMRALNTWREAGGALLLALEPDGPDMAPLLSPLGLSYDPHAVLAIDQNYVPITNRVIDRINLATNTFSTHDSVTTLSQNSRTAFVIVPGAGVLSEEEPVEGVKTNITVKALEQAWADLDGDLTFDAQARPVSDGNTENVCYGYWGVNVDPSGSVGEQFAGLAACEASLLSAEDSDALLSESQCVCFQQEERRAWPLAVAVSGGPEESEYRVVVTADSTWISDMLLLRNKGNAQWLMDSLAWLLNDSTSSGTINDEKDVKIQHTREGQGWWFYATSFLIPFGLFGLGQLRIRSRKRNGGDR